MTDWRATLPERDEMLRRLRGVIDEPHATEGFYPRLLALAGQPMSGVEVAAAFQVAVYDFARESGRGPLAATLADAAPRFMAAIVDDETARRYALWALGFEAEPETDTAGQPS